MIIKQKYVEYLISTPINCTCTNLAENLEDTSHDVVSNYLKRERLTAGIWWNKHSADGRNVNQLTPQDETDMGASASFYDVRVFVEAV